MLQGALNGVDRLYFHQGTISNCVRPFLLFVDGVTNIASLGRAMQAYCFWGQSSIFTPYYGAAFVSEFLGTDGTRVAMLDDGSTPIGVYAIYSAANAPVRLLVVNTVYYDGSGARSNVTVTFTNVAGGVGSRQAKRMTAPNATSRADAGAEVTIGGSASFTPTCTRNGVQNTETVNVNASTMQIIVGASEALIVYL